MRPIESWPSVPSFGARLTGAFARHGQLCVGIDPSRKQLSSWSLPDTAKGAKEFALKILEACQGQVGIVKPQVAFFEQYGPAGLSALSEILVEAKSAGLVVIADAKRGDIGSSMTGYARAWLSREASFEVDALTLSPYLGAATLAPTIESALDNSKGVFLLAATSNPEAVLIQGAQHSGQSVAGIILSYAGSYNKTDLGSVGCVVGATVSLEKLGLSPSFFNHTPILMPGFGAQGVKLSSVNSLFGELAPLLICSVSRAIAGDSQNGLSDRVAAAKLELNRGILK